MADNDQRQVAVSRWRQPTAKCRCLMTVPGGHALVACLDGHVSVADPWWPFFDGRSPMADDRALVAVPWRLCAGGLALVVLPREPTDDEEVQVAVPRWP